MKGIIVTLLIATSFSLNAQQIGFGSLYHEDFGIVNSAFLAKGDATQVYLNYRKQWMNIPNSPEYINGLLSLPIKNNRIGLGLQVHSHEIGMLKRQRIMGGYRYRIQLNDKHRLQLGVSAGLERNLIDLSRIEAQDMNELAFYQSNQRAVVGSFNVGLAYQFKQLNVGVSMDFYSASRLTFTNPTYNNPLAFSKVPSYNFQASYALKIKERWTYTPSVLVYSTQGLPLFLDFSNRFELDNKLSFGVGYRQLRDLNASFGYTFVNQLKVMYLYQHQLGKLTQNFSGTHEIALVFSINRNANDNNDFKTSDKRAAELQEQMDLSQRKIDELNRQLDSINQRLANQDVQIAELKAAQIGDDEIKSLIDSLGSKSSDDMSTIKLKTYEVVNVGSEKDLANLLEDGTSTYQIVLGAFRNLEKARELNRTLLRDMGLSQELVEIKVGEKSMYFVCLKDQYTSVKKAGADLLAFKKANSAQYAKYLNGEPWILKMKR